MIIHHFRTLCNNQKQRKIFIFGKHSLFLVLTLAEGDPKAPFSKATTLRCRGRVLNSGFNENIPNFGKTVF